MIQRGLAVCALILGLTISVSAQERVVVGTMQTVNNGALFMADAAGYFKAEGLDVEMKAYTTPQAVAEALAAGALDFGLAEFSAEAFNHAGKGEIKAIAAQAREKKQTEGNEVLAANAAYAAGMHKIEDLRNHSIGVTFLGSPYHYQVGEIARQKNFDVKSINVKAFQTLDGVATALVEGQIDAVIVPVLYARALLVAGQGRLVAWCSEFDESQLGALFASSKMISTRREVVEKFVHAYQRGAGDYSTALTRHDRYGKRVSDEKSRTAGTTIARYIYQGHPLGSAATTVETGAYFIDPQARLDEADIERQIAWFKAQGLVEQSVDPHQVVDLSFLAAH
ncbi:MAG: ABC transporter substrate-binding protein [Pseudolabrys sp.]